MREGPPLRQADMIWAGTALAACLVAFVCLPVWDGVAGAALALLMVAIGRTDGRSYHIPDGLNLASFGLGLVYCGLGGREWATALIMALVCSGVFYGLRAIWLMWRGVEALGLGDVKLAAVAGLWLEPLPFVCAVEGAVGLALVMLALRARARGRSLRQQKRVAFGAAFAPMIWMAWFGQNIYPQAV